MAAVAKTFLVLLMRGSYLSDALAAQVSASRSANDQRLIAVRIAVISVVSKRCRTTDAKKNRRSAARDLGSVLNFLGKVLGWLAVRWVDFFEAQHS
jgi:hypothetical protein